MENKSKLNREIKCDIKKYIAVEQLDMYTYEDMSKEDLAETEAIIKALTDEKIEIIIKDVDWSKYDRDSIICDIFENILYRITNKEHKFLFEDGVWVNE